LGSSGTAGSRCQAAGQRTSGDPPMKTASNLATLLEAFFTDRLIRQRQASTHTIASYRDTFRLLLGFAQRNLKKAPSDLALEDLDAGFVGSFLDYFEKERGNGARSRN